MAQRDPDRDPSPGRPERALLALGGGVLCFALAKTIADPDLWGHVLFGGDLIRTGRVVRPDPYSYLTAGQPWINHEWLAEALFYFAYRAAGATDWEVWDLERAMNRIAELVKKTRDETFIEKLPNGKLVNMTPAIFALGGATLEVEFNHVHQKLMRGLGIVAIENQARI